MMGSVSTWVPVRTSAVRTEAGVAGGPGSESTRQFTDLTIARKVAGVWVVVLTLGQGWAMARVQSSGSTASLGEVMVPYAGRERNRIPRHGSTRSARREDKGIQRDWPMRCLHLRWGLAI